MMQQASLTACLLALGVLFTYGTSWILVARRPPGITPPQHMSRTSLAEPAWIINCNHLSHRVISDFTPYHGADKPISPGVHRYRIPNLDLPECEMKRLVRTRHARPQEPMNESHLSIWRQDWYGWPWLALTYEIKYQQLVPYGSRCTGVFGALDWQDAERRGIRVTEVRALPLRPVWAGFLGNSLLFAASMYLFGWTAFRGRRLVRSRRGRCASCGYPIGTSRICSECGAKVEKEK